jgi:hypothetical protein
LTPFRYRSVGTPDGSTRALHRWTLRPSRTENTLVATEFCAPPSSPQRADASQGRVAMRTPE